MDCAHRYGATKCTRLVKKKSDYEGNFLNSIFNVCYSVYATRITYMVGFTTYINEIICVCFELGIKIYVRNICLLSQYHIGIAH